MANKLHKLTNSTDLAMPNTANCNWPEQMWPAIERI